MKQIYLIISGRVQGVFFRSYTEKKAIELGLKGWVKNADSGDVEILAQGKESGLNQLIQWCKTGPEHAKVDNIKIKWQAVSGNFNGFSILP